MKTQFYIALALLHLVLGFGLTAVTATEGEEALKTAAVLAFLQNTRWSEALPPGQPIRVCVAGRAAVLRAFQSGMESKLVDGHPIHVLELKQQPPDRACQLLYIATVKAPEIRAILPSGASPVLTVGETDRFLEMGGAVNLFLVDGHIGFEVSLSALERARIEISSKLLRFGQIHDAAKGKEVR